MGISVGMLAAIAVQKNKKPSGKEMIKEKIIKALDWQRGLPLTIAVYSIREIADEAVDLNAYTDVADKSRFP